MQRGHDVSGVIDRQGGLGDKGQLVWVAHRNSGHVSDGFHQQDLALGKLAHGADCFRVALVTDHNHLQSGSRVALRLDMHLGDQRAGGIHIDHLAQ